MKRYLEVSTSRQYGEYRLVLKGPIDEVSEFPSLDAAESIRFDLAGVDHINSLGIQRWYTWLRERGPQSKVILERCTPPIVRLLGAVNLFYDSTLVVESFYVPYFDESSGGEENILFRLGIEFDDKGNVTPPEVKGKSGQLLEMDVIEKTYFKFIRR